MSIGRRSSGKRPRNDLDDYLDEVESYLFCVTQADRTCLMRDLKAHVKELTTDPRFSEKYPGLYQISREQLVREVGDPKNITTDYITSVRERVPSLGLKLFIILMTFVFTGIIFIGAERYGLPSIVDNVSWLRATGVTFIIVGGLGIAFLFLSVIRFERFHMVLLYLVIAYVLLAIPLAAYLARELIFNMGMTTEPLLNSVYTALFIINLIVIGIVGITVYMKHVTVIEPRTEIY